MSLRALKAQLRAASTLLSRLNLARTAGMLFGGDRNLYEVYGYKRDLTYQDFEERYKRQDIAARIIDAPVQATWRRPPIVADSDGPEGKFAKAWSGMAKEQKLYFNLERVDRLASLGQYAVLMLGFDNSPNTEAAVPGSAKLLYTQPFSQPNATIKKFEDNKQNERFGKPKTYKLDLVSPDSRQSHAARSGTKGSSSSIMVDHSRILHVSNALLEDEVYGEPALARVYNLLDDLLKIAGGSAETFWLTSNRGMQVDVDKDMELDDADAEALQEEVDEYVHDLSRVMKTKGVKVTSLGDTTADPTSAFRVTMPLIAGAKAIPLRILLGSEEGSLASEQDRANWANRVEERQTGYATPVIVVPLAEKLVATSVLPEAKGDIIVTWPDAFAPSPLERAQTMAQKARAATNLAKALENAASFITPDEAREIMGLLPTVETSPNNDIPGDVDTPDEDAEGNPARAAVIPIKKGGSTPDTN